MKRSIVVAALGTAQTLAWGSSYYLPAILADPIAQGVGLSRTTVFGLFSGALLFTNFCHRGRGRRILTTNFSQFGTPPSPSFLPDHRTGRMHGPLQSDGAMRRGSPMFPWVLGFGSILCLSGVGVLITVTLRFAHKAARLLDS